jgi:hypothetical protein
LTAEPDDDVTMRAITGPEELALFNAMPYVLNDELADDLAEGRRRPEWMWVALRGNRLQARLAWWCRFPGDPPDYLDILDLDDGRVDLGVRLLRTAMAAALPDRAAPPQYGRFIPPDWRDHAPVRRAVEDRMAVAERTGATFFVERLRLEWRQGSPVPAASERLVFRPVGAAGELLDLMVPVLDGTLDAHSHDDLTRMSAREVARQHYEDEFARYSSPRDWWQIASLPDGDPVGFVIPARNAYNPIIAYLGVLPRHRGHGYINDILGEGTRILAGQGVTHIRTTTDLGNKPMAAAFARAGYHNFERQIDMVWR